MRRGGFERSHGNWNHGELWKVFKFYDLATSEEGFPAIMGSDLPSGGLGWGGMWEMNEEWSSGGQNGDSEDICNNGEDVAEWVRTRLGLAVDELQARVLRTKAKQGILNCSRQWGKSTVTAAMAVHRAFHEAESLTMVVSPSARQSGEFLRKANGFVRKLGLRPKGDGDNELSLELPNRSRIVGLPGTEATIRGFSAVSLMLVDEAARVNDELYKTIRPMLATSGGTIWLMSTPMGKRGFFYETWANGGAKWERFQAPATECARIPKAFLDEERATMGERWFGQEYMCEFGETLSGIFSRELVERAITYDVKPLIIP